MKNYYNIINLGINEDGEFCVTYTGEVPEQGGMSLGKSSVYFKDFDDTRNFIHNIVLKNLSNYKYLIEQKEKNNVRTR